MYQVAGKGQNKNAFQIFQTEFIYLFIFAASYTQLNTKHLQFLVRTRDSIFTFKITFHNFFPFSFHPCCIVMKLMSKVSPC